MPGRVDWLLYSWQNPGFESCRKLTYKALISVNRRYIKDENKVIFEAKISERKVL